MKRVIALLIASVVLLPLSVNAEITSSGGTEDFESLGLSDETTLSDLNLPTNWTITGATDNSYFNYDTNETSGWSAAGGAGTKTAGSASVKAVAGEAVDARCISPAVSGRQATYTFWWAASVVNSGANIWIGLRFESRTSENSGPHVFLNFFPDTKDIQFKVAQFLDPLGGGSGQVFNLGLTKNGDDTDYALDIWNKCEIEISSSESETGKITITFNGTTYTDVGGPADATGELPVASDSNDLLEHSFVFNTHTATAGTFYFDDITISTDTDVSDWMMFD